MTLWRLLCHKGKPSQKCSLRCIMTMLATFSFGMIYWDLAMPERNYLHLPRLSKASWFSTGGGMSSQNRKETKCSDDLVDILSSFSLNNLSCWQSCTWKFLRSRAKLRRCQEVKNHKWVTGGRRGQNRRTRKKPHNAVWWVDDSVFTWGYASTALPSRPVSSDGCLTSLASATSAQIATTALRIGREVHRRGWRRECGGFWSRKRCRAIQQESWVPQEGTVGQEDFVQGGSALYMQLLYCARKWSSTMSSGMIWKSNTASCHI